VPLQVYSVPWGGRAGCFAYGSGCAACVSTCCAYGLTLRAFLSLSLCVHARLLLPSTILFFVIVRTCSFVAPPSSILFVTCTVCLTCGVVRLGDVIPNLQKEKKKICLWLATILRSEAALSGIPVRQYCREMPESFIMRGKLLQRKALRALCHAFVPGLEAVCMVLSMKKNLVHMHEYFLLSSRASCFFSFFF
jgi:hypothetical protein